MDRHNRDATVTMASEATPKGVTVLMLVGVGLLDTQHRLTPSPPGLHPYLVTTRNFWPSPSFLLFLDVSHAVPGPPAVFQVVARPLLLPTAHTHLAHLTPPSSSSTAATLPSVREGANRGARIFSLGPGLCPCQSTLWSAWRSQATLCPSAPGATGGYPGLEQLSGSGVVTNGWGRLHDLGPFQGGRWLYIRMHSRWGPSVGFVMQPSLALLSTRSTGSSRADGPNKWRSVSRTGKCGTFSTLSLSHSEPRECPTVELTWPAQTPSAAPYSTSTSCSSESSVAMVEWSRAMVVCFKPK